MKLLLELLALVEDGENTDSTQQAYLMGVRHGRKGQKIDAQKVFKNMYLSYERGYKKGEEEASDLNQKDRIRAQDKKSADNALNSRHFRSFQ